MISRTLMLTLLLLTLPVVVLSNQTMAAAAADQQRLFQEANQAYSGGDFRQAIALYEEVLTSHGFSVSVLFNLGNSYAQAGQVGRAVLSYERGLRLAPDDADLQGNLQLLRREKGLFAEPPQGWQPFLLLSLDRWALIALTALLLLSLWRLAALKNPWARRYHLSISLFCLAVLLVATTATAVRYRSFNPSVVIADDARLLLSPFPSAASVGAIQEGRLMVVEKSHGDYLYVADENGRRGWMVVTQLEQLRR
jgi:tetratricopeptide (TPR) repeat protein